MPATVAFSYEQQQCLSTLAPTINGKAQLQQNLYLPEFLARATWIIAQLGG